MARNYFPMKTGHAASDEYFKHVALWYDSDMLKTFIHGTLFGILLTLMIIIFTI
jgi:hypothetical protein